MSGHIFKLRWHWYSDTEGEWEVTEAPRLGGLQDGTEMLLAPANESEIKLSPLPEPVAVVRSVVSPGKDGVRITWLNGFPQIGDRLYVAPHPTRAPLTNKQMLDCVRAVGAPEPMGLTRDRGPYEVTEPTWFLIKLVRAIERTHGITGEGGND